MIGASKIIRDITARKQAEEELIGDDREVRVGVQPVGDLRRDHGSRRQSARGQRPRSRCADTRGRRCSTGRSGRPPGGAARRRCRSGSASRRGGPRRARSFVRRCRTGWRTAASASSTSRCTRSATRRAVRFLYPTGIDITDRARRGESAFFWRSLTSALTPLTDSIEIATVGRGDDPPPFRCGAGEFRGDRRRRPTISLFSPARSPPACEDDRTTQRSLAVSGETMAAALREGGTVVVDDVAGDPALRALGRESYRAMRVAAIMLSPHFVSGKWTSSLSVRGQVAAPQLAEPTSVRCCRTSRRESSTGSNGRAPRSRCGRWRPRSARSRSVCSGRCSREPGRATGARSRGPLRGGQRPALEVGGDWYDVFPLPDGESP